MCIADAGYMQTGKQPKWPWALRTTVYICEVQFHFDHLNIKLAYFMH
jgi:hypothetical protein